MMRICFTQLLFLLLCMVWLTATVLAGESTVKTLKVSHGISAEGQKCIECHAQKTPGIVADWKTSRHGHVGISCIDCHSVDKGSPLATQNCPGVKGTEIYVSLLVTPKTCGRCHAAEVEQFNKSGHYRGRIQYNAEGARNYASMKALIATHEGQGLEEFQVSSDATGCMQCHGSEIVLDENGRPTPETWPNAGIATIYPDGSVGNCVACHTRHTFNIAEARKPAACASCHLGPDHPDIEIFNNSKHGHIYNSEGADWNYHAAPGAWEPGDYRTPTCAVCHISGIGALNNTHNVSERLYWNLWGKSSAVRNSADPLSPLTGNGVEGRKLMKQVCSNCHTTLHTDNFFVQGDKHVELYNKGYWNVAKKMTSELKERGLLKENPWADEYQRVLYHLWHHEGRRMRQGALMAAPDYAHWHGVFECMQDLNELKAIYNKRMETGKIEE